MYKSKNVFQRLVNKPKNKKNRVNSPDCKNFAPMINPISEEIDYNLNGQDNIPRWEKLYMLQNERDQANLMAKQVQPYYLTFYRCNTMNSNKQK